MVYVRKNRLSGRNPSNARLLEVQKNLAIINLDNESRVLMNDGEKPPHFCMTITENLFLTKFVKF